MRIEKWKLGSENPNKRREGENGEKEKKKEKLKCPRSSPSTQNLNSTSTLDSPLPKTSQTMDSPTTSREHEQWELCNDDGFVYKRKRRRLDPAAAVTETAAQLSSTTEVDQEAAAEKGRRERKRQTLLKLKAKYQREIHQWDTLSSTLRSMQEKALQLQRERERAREQTSSLASPSTTTKGTDSARGSLVDELLLQVEAQEAIIHDISNLCDVAEAMCFKQEEQFKQSLFDLPIWGSPLELMEVLCDD